MRIDLKHVHEVALSMSVNTANGFQDEQRLSNQKSLMAAAKLIHSFDQRIPMFSNKPGMDVIVRSLLDTTLRYHTNVGLKEFGFALGVDVNDPAKPFPNFIERFRQKTDFLGQGLSQNQINAYAESGGFNQEAISFEKEVMEPILKLQALLGDDVKHQKYSDISEFGNKLPFEAYKALTGGDSFQDNGHFSGLNLDPILKIKGFEEFGKFNPVDLTGKRVHSFALREPNEYANAITTIFNNAIFPVTSYFNFAPEVESHVNSCIRVASYFYVESLKQLEVIKRQPFDTISKGLLYKPFLDTSVYGDNAQSIYNLILDLTPRTIIENQVQGMFDYDVYLAYFAEKLHPITGTYQFSNLEVLIEDFKEAKILPMDIAVDMAIGLTNEKIENLSETDKKSLAIRIKAILTQQMSSVPTWF